MPAKDPEQLTGTYKSSQSGKMTVTKEKKIIILKYGDNNIYTLYPRAANSFFTKERDLVFEFISDARGKPVKMIVKEHGTLADEWLFQK